MTVADDLYLEIQTALAKVYNSEDDVLWYIYQKEKEMSELKYGVEKDQVIYFIDPAGEDPVEMKGITSLSESFASLGATVEESAKAFSDMAEVWTSVTYDIKLERGASKLLWAIFGVTKKQLKKEALEEHYRKKALRDETREDTERSKMHAAYRRRQKSRGRRNRH